MPMPLSEAIPRQRLAVMRSQARDMARQDNVLRRLSKRARRKELKAQVDNRYATVENKKGEILRRSQSGGSGFSLTGFGQSRASGRSLGISTPSKSPGYGAPAPGVVPGRGMQTKTEGTSGSRTVSRAQRWTTSGYREVGPRPQGIDSTQQLKSSVSQTGPVSPPAVRLWMGFSQGTSSQRYKTRTEAARVGSGATGIGGRVGRGVPFADTPPPSAPGVVQPSSIVSPQRRRRRSRIARRLSAVGRVR